MQAVLEGLQHQEATVEREPPPGTLTVTLHAYQKRALAWMLYREEKAKGVRGGILAGGVTLPNTALVLAGTRCSNEQKQLPLPEVQPLQSDVPLCLSLLVLSMMRAAAPCFTQGCTKTSCSH